MKRTDGTGFMCLVFVCGCTESLAFRTRGCVHRCLPAAVLWEFNGPSAKGCSHFIFQSANNVPSCGAETRTVKTWVWRCKECQVECVPVRSSSFCICGHRQQYHTSGSHECDFRCVPSVLLWCQRSPCSRGRGHAGVDLLDSEANCGGVWLQVQKVPVQEVLLHHG